MFSELLKFILLCIEKTLKKKRHFKIAPQNAIKYKVLHSYNFLQCHFVSEKIKNNFLKVKILEMDFFISISIYFKKLDKQNVNKIVKK